jgi:hypothetical protein
MKVDEMDVACSTHVRYEKLENLKERDHSENLVVDMRIV